MLEATTSSSKVAMGVVPIRPVPALDGAPSQTAADMEIKRGACSALFAYDLGFAIDLRKAQELLALAPAGSQRETLKHTRRAPKYFEVQPPPLRVTRAGAPVSVGKFTSSPVLEALIYDFGSMSISFTIPIDGPAKDLLPLSNGLYENAALLAESRRLVEALVAELRPAITKPDVAHFVEDYLVFHIDEWSLPAGFATLNDWIASSRPMLAKILRSDTEPLSPQEVEDALSCRISYAQDDAAMIDWNAAIVIGKEMQDVRAVLEFANVELLEMRFLDDQLDRALAEAFESTQRGERNVFASTASDMRRIARLQMDSAILFEGVNNALKLLGDQYLARVYRLAAGRMHLPAWDASIIRKLGTLESIYDKIADRQSGRRMEVLEWIIILLITFEVVMSFVRWH